MCWVVAGLCVASAVFNSLVLLAGTTRAASEQPPHIDSPAHLFRVGENGVRTLDGGELRSITPLVRVRACAERAEGALDLHLLCIGAGQVVGGSRSISMQ